MSSIAFFILLHQDGHVRLDSADFRICSSQLLFFQLKLALLIFESILMVFARVLQFCPLLVQLEGMLLLQLRH
jgi:hypothetical protein